MDAPKIRALIAQLQAELGAADKPDPTVAELCGAYVDSPDFRGLADSQTERGRIVHLIRLLGPLRVSHMGLAVIDDYRTTRAGEAGSRKGSTTAAATRNREVVRLVRILNWAVERAMIDANPIAGAALEAENNTRRTSLEADDIDALEAACPLYKPSVPRIGLVLWAMIATKFDSGMRRKETCLLRRSQQKLVDGAIHLHAQDTKGKKGRITILSARAVDAQRAMPRDLRFADSPFVFLTQRGKPYHPRTFLRMFQEVCKLAGIEAAEGENVWAHDLRAGFIGQQLELHRPEREIMNMTGHTTHAVFDRYVRRKKSAVAVAKKLLDELHKQRKNAAKSQNGTDVGEGRLAPSEEKTS